MMHSWASRSRCCAWEACSESSSGVVHPADPKVASSWGPVTHTQGMESQFAPSTSCMLIYFFYFPAKKKRKDLKFAVWPSGGAVDFKPE